MQNVGANPTSATSFNINIVECKLKYQNVASAEQIGFNINIVECK